MSEELSSWLKKHKAKMDKISTSEMSQMVFFRDPMRPRLFDHNTFYSPADGIILYSKIVNPNETFEIKGREYSLEEVFEDYNPPQVPCLCIGIFMTYLDVHVNRMPTEGILSFNLLPPLSTYNYPMLFAEQQLLAKHFSHAFEGMSYEKYNARMLNRIYSPSLDYAYWVIQIADDEVNTITHFTVNQNQWFHQNDRFSFVRWGSQVDLILPLDQRYQFNPLVPEQYHVQGAIDKLVQITPS